MSVDKEYFKSQEYLEGQNDPNELYFDEAWVQLLARGIFPPDWGGRLFDWGAGSGLWMKQFQTLGLKCAGIDLAPAKELHHPGIKQGDLTTYRLETPVQYGFCNGVLMYLNMPEIAFFLHKFYASFEWRGYICTPDPEVALLYDKNATMFVPVPLLLQMCREVGGFPVVLNFRRSPETATGPAILWFKNEADAFSSHGILRTRDYFLEQFKGSAGYWTDFSITL